MPELDRLLALFAVLEAEGALRASEFMGLQLVEGNPRHSSPQLLPVFFNQLFFIKFLEFLPVLIIYLAINLILVLSQLIFTELIRLREKQALIV